MYGEKFIEYKIENNKIIRINEFKSFKHNYLDLLEEINDRITEDWEAFADRKVYFNRMEEFDNFDVDYMLDWIGELVSDAKDEEEETEWLEEWIKPLEEAKGFVIHINYNPKWAEQEAKSVK